MDIINSARHTLKTLLNQYRAEGITVEIERDEDLSYPTIFFRQGARGLVHKEGPDAIDLLFDIEKVKQLLAESKTKEALDRKAWQLEQAGYTVIPPAENSPTENIINKEISK
jgi:hypothetical protein